MGASRGAGKIAIVVGGYVASILGAAFVVALYVAATAGPDRQTYGAMYDFGDTLLFLAVFGVLALFPTTAALFFLRPYRSVWIALAVVSLGIAATGLAASIDYVVQPATQPGSILGLLSAAAVLRMLLAPLLAAAFLLAGVFAPHRASRITLLAAGSIEALAFASLAVVLL